MSGFRLSGSPSSLQFTSEGLHSWTGSAYGLSVGGPTDTQTLLVQPGDPAVELLSQESEDRCHSSGSALEFREHCKRGSQNLQPGFGRSNSLIGTTGPTQMDQNLPDLRETGPAGTAPTRSCSHDIPVPRCRTSSSGARCHPPGPAPSGPHIAPSRYRA